MTLGVHAKMALNSLRAAKLRSFLTMFAVIIGIAAFVIVTTTVDGLKNAVSEEINALGGNLVTVSPGKLVERDESGEITSFNIAAGFGISTLTERDLRDIRRLDSVEAAAPLMAVTGLVSRAEKELSGGIIIATNDDYPRALAQNVEFGEFFSDQSDQPFTVIGQGAALELYGGSPVLGTTIKIRGQDFTLLGVIEEYKTSIPFGPNLNNAVFISIKKGKKLAGGATQIQEIDLRVADDSDIETAADEVFQTLLENHGGEEDFTVLKQDEFIDSAENVLDVIKSASQFIAYIMLFVGMVVILLIMLITVTERTREIGIRKSIGATRSNLALQFLTEALILSWVGSVIGIITGFLLGFVVRSSTDVTPQYSINTLLAVMVAGTVIGAIGGLYPAMRAARKDPVEALRHE